ncbi:hypothetical protein [Pseudomonas japonica]|uniref:hypothetical protein n=1 Tax=Pseudomonas japonica TaxID=256466 RepID=UPI003A876FB7
MSAYQVPLASVMLLQHLLEKGGSGTCTVRRPEDQDQATITAEVGAGAVALQVEFKSVIRNLRLQPGDSANHLHLRDFIQDLANDRADHIGKALALMDAHGHVSAQLPENHLAYISPTPWPDSPFAAVITDNSGALCAVAIGSSKEALAAQVRTKLGLATQGNGEPA